MTAYVGLTVALHLHGSPKSPEELRVEVDKLLRDHFNPELDGDIEVTLDESAGS